MPHLSRLRPKSAIYAIELDAPVSLAQLYVVILDSLGETVPTQSSVEAAVLAQRANMDFLVVFGAEWLNGQCLHFLRRDGELAVPTILIGKTKLPGVLKQDAYLADRTLYFTWLPSNEALPPISLPRTEIIMPGAPGYNEAIAVVSRQLGNQIPSIT